MARQPLSILFAAGFVALFAATSQVPDFVRVDGTSEIVPVTLDDQGEVSGQVIVGIDGLQQPLDALDIELRVLVGGEDVPRWLRLVQSDDWQPRANDALHLASPTLLCEPAPEPCEAVVPFVLSGRRDRTVDVPFAAELGFLQWGDLEAEELVDSLDGATVRIEVVLD